MNHSIEPSPVPAAGHYNYCASCSLVYLGSSRFCRQCGTQLLELAETRRCPHCQQEHRLQARFCPATGALIPALQAAAGVDWQPETAAPAGSAGEAQPAGAGQAPDTANEWMDVMVLHQPAAGEASPGPGLTPAAAGTPAEAEPASWTASIWEVPSSEALWAANPPAPRQPASKPVSAGQELDSHQAPTRRIEPPPAAPASAPAEPAAAPPAAPVQPPAEPDSEPLLDSHNAPTRMITHPPEPPAGWPPAPPPAPEQPALPAAPPAAPVPPAPQAGSTPPIDTHDAPTRLITHLPEPPAEWPPAPPLPPTPETGSQPPLDSHSAPTRRINHPAQPPEEGAADKTGPDAANPVEPGPDEPSQR